MGEESARESAPTRLREERFIIHPCFWPQTRISPYHLHGISRVTITFFPLSSFMLQICHFDVFLFLLVCLPARLAR
jgi:hypothetical protein